MDKRAVEFGWAEGMELALGFEVVVVREIADLVLQYLSLNIRSESFQ